MNAWYSLAGHIRLILERRTSFEWELQNNYQRLKTEETKKFLSPGKKRLLYMDIEAT
jgi:hypothetical protein